MLHWSIVQFFVYVNREQLSQFMTLLLLSVDPLIVPDCNSIDNISEY